MYQLYHDTSVYMDYICTCLWALRTRGPSTYIYIQYTPQRCGISIYVCHTVQVARAQVEYVRQWVEVKRPPVQVATSDTTMCASRVLALVDRRITPQVQDAKVRAQDVRSGPTSAQVSRDAAVTFKYNHHHHHRQCKMQQVAPPQVQGVFAPMAEGKTPPAQVAGRDHHHVCKWSTCAG